MRDRPLRILEIGVYLGASLKLWRRYFSHPETCVVGIDIQQACAQFQDSSNGIEVRIGSQADPAFLKSVVDEFGPFDLIVDDGSHQTAHQIISFNELFLTGLKESGIYFVEDTHTNFWPRWRDSERSFVDLCKDLIDLMHAHYPSAGPNFFFAASETGEKTEGVVVPQITPLIREIRFFDSIIVIHKTRRPYVPFTVTTAQE
jgi:hypothetical protein